MAPRSLLALALRLIGLFVLCFSLALITSAIGIPPEVAAQVPASEGPAALAGLAAAALVNAALVAYMVLRSRWHGWRLALTVALVFYGLHTFLQQIETIAFPAVADRMPDGLVASLFWTGALFAAILGPAAVLLLGKWRAPAQPLPPASRLALPASEWAWKAAVGVVLYECVYFIFGYYVAWRTPGLPEFYGGVDPGTFWGQIANVMRDTPWLPAYQVLRALLWMLCALPVIRMLKGPHWETMLAVGLLLSLIVSVQLFIPNPFWPAFVGRAHLIELASSNFVFGVLVSGLWLGRPAAPAARTISQPRPIG
jgi:hypothetical protein